MQLFSKSGLSNRLFQLTLCFFGVRWSTTLHRLQFLQLICWLCWYAVIWTWTALGPAIFVPCTLDCLLSYTLFLCMTASHLIILLDTFLQRQRYEQLLQFSQTQDTWTLQTQDQVDPTIAGLLLFILVVRCLIVWTRLGLENLSDMTIFWFGTPSVLAVQLKLIAFLSDLLKTNTRVRSLRQRIKLVSRRVHLDVSEVMQLKQYYSQLYQHFVQLNCSYGNSLLIIFIVLFFDFVFNAYWMLQNVLARPSNPQIVVHRLTILSYLGPLLSLTCWHCQQSYNLSRQIGCLISKLVKPLGSKRYNDLVTEFLLQTMHQHFVVTAKDFFSLNLHLLSSMFAAVVTYLVILIQFMFAEKGSQSSQSTQLSRAETS